MTEYRDIEDRMRALLEGIFSGGSEPEFVSINGRWLSTKHPGKVSDDLVLWRDRNGDDDAVLRPWLDAYRAAGERYFFGTPTE